LSFAEKRINASPARCASNVVDCEWGRGKRLVREENHTKREKRRTKPRLRKFVVSPILWLISRVTAGLVLVHDTPRSRGKGRKRKEKLTDLRSWRDVS